MRAGEGHPSCRAWEGERFTDYLERLARTLGLPVEAPGPVRREWPKDGRSQQMRIDAIMSGERDKGREPGADG